MIIGCQMFFDGSLLRLIYPGGRVTCRVLVSYNDIPKLELNLSISISKQNLSRSIVGIPWSPSHDLPSILATSVSLAVFGSFWNPPDRSVLTSWALPTGLVAQPGSSRLGTLRVSYRQAPELFLISCHNLFNMLNRFWC